jgi:hypothetical protein
MHFLKYCHWLIVTVVILSTSSFVSSQPNELSEQQRMDIYYSLDNVIPLTITMDSHQWTKLKNQQPLGGPCNNGSFIGDRYTWFSADRLKIETTFKGAPKSATVKYDNIGVKKKSYCGSISSVKPSLNINLSKYNNNNEAKAKGEIGTTHLTLNNSLQDPSILKQCLGYHLFRLAGLPASRCNFSSLSIYFPDKKSTEYVGIYVNVEPIKKNYMKNTANGLSAKDKGNLYEIATHDFTLDGVTYNDYKGYSDDYIRQDFGFAADEMQANLTNGIHETINVDQFTRYWAMEGVLQSYDGYSNNVTNSYVYNDIDLGSVDFLVNGQDNNVNFAFLPWGIDKTMNSNSCWQIYRCACVAKGLFDTQKNSVLTEFSDLIDLFSKKQREINVFIDALAANANATWTGNDALFGANDGTIKQSASDRKAWLEAAIENAVLSLGPEGDNSCLNVNQCFNGMCPYR